MPALALSPELLDWGSREDRAGSPGAQAASPTWASSYKPDPGWSDPGVVTEARGSWLPQLRGSGSTQSERSSRPSRSGSRLLSAPLQSWDRVAATPMAVVNRWPCPGLGSRGRGVPHPWTAARLRGEPFRRRTGLRSQTGKLEADFPGKARPALRLLDAESLLLKPRVRRQSRAGRHVACAGRAPRLRFTRVRRRRGASSRPGPAAVRGRANWRPSSDAQRRPSRAVLAPSTGWVSGECRTQGQPAHGSHSSEPSAAVTRAH